MVFRNDIFNPIYESGVRDKMTPDINPKCGQFLNMGLVQAD